jgi:hypothetical protein
MRELKFIEEWKDISEFKEYEVSNFGRVRGKDRFRKGKNGLCFLKGKELKQVINKRGYPEVRFRKNGTHIRVVHRLVAKAFIPNLENKPQVNHVDGNKLNNRVDNLGWMNNSENQKHAYFLGLQPDKCGERNGRAKLTNEKVTSLKELYNLGKSAREVSEIMNISLYTVRQIISGTTWKINKTNIIKRDERFKSTTKYEKRTKICNLSA